VQLHIERQFEVLYLEKNVSGIDWCKLHISIVDGPFQILFVPCCSKSVSGRNRTSIAALPWHR